MKDDYTDKYFAEKNSRNTALFRPPRPPKHPKDELNRYCISMARKQAALSSGFSVHRVTQSSVGQLDVIQEYDIKKEDPTPKMRHYRS